MSSQSDKFQVVLQSNVKGNPRNKPSLYETELANPLDLLGEWDVALINISYSHNWKNLDMINTYLLLKPQNDKEQINYEPDAESDLLDLADVITRAPEFRTRWDVVCGSDIPIGNLKYQRFWNS